MKKGKAGKAYQLTERGRVLFEDLSKAIENIETHLCKEKAIEDG